MKKQFLYFITSHGIFTLAVELINIFGLLYLYEISGRNAIFSIGSFAMIYYSYGIFFYPVIHIIEKIGTKPAIIIGSLMILAGNFFIQLVVFNIYYVIGWIVLVSIGKIFYFISYNYYVEILIDDKKMGQGSGALVAAMTTVSLAIPLIGGIATQYFGIGGLTIFSILFLVASLIPLFELKNYKFTISRRLSDMFIIPNINKLIKLNFINEVQNKEKFWELYIFIFFAESYSNFGLFLTLVTVITIPLNFLLGRYLDHHNRKSVLKLTAFFTSCIWFFRTIGQTLLHFTLIDVSQEVVGGMKNQIVRTLNVTYLMKDDQQVLLDERIAVKEITQNFFVASNLIIGLLIMQLFGFQAVFVFAAITSLLFYLL